MPSPEHEILIEMFRERPAFAAEVLAHVLGVEVPPFQTAQLSSDELTDIAPTEYRADAVVTFSVDGRPVLAVVIEVQLRVDARKRRSWPVYVATLHARLGCPVRLLVVCPGAAVAAWCAAAIVAGDLVLRPRVLGPRQVPLVTDPLVARDSPHLAVLSAMAHGSRPDPDPVFEALLTALSVVDQDHADLYTYLVFAVLPQAARNRMEEFMTTTTHEYKSVFARRYYGDGKAEGKAEGEADAVLAVLDARGVEVPVQDRERIASCRDLDQLKAWVRRAATANKIQDLDEPAG